MTWHTYHKRTCPNANTKHTELHKMPRLLITDELIKVNLKLYQITVGIFRISIKYNVIYKISFHKLFLYNTKRIACLCNAVYQSLNNYL